MLKEEKSLLVEEIGSFGGKISVYCFGRIEV